jgi:hypothetical protein
LVSDILHRRTSARGKRFWPSDAVRLLPDLLAALDMKMLCVGVAASLDAEVSSASRHTEAASAFQG